MRNINFSYTPRAPSVHCDSGNDQVQRGQRSSSKGRSGSRLGDETQFARIGRVTQHPERLTFSRRQSLPRHLVLQGRLIGASVWRRNFKRHFDEPGVGRRERQLLGMNDSRDAWEPLIVGRCLRRRSCVCQHRACQQCCCGSAELHDVFRSGCDVCGKTTLLAAHNKIKVHVALSEMVRDELVAALESRGVAVDVL